jgi:hypothetical protein
MKHLLARTALLIAGVSLFSPALEAQQGSRAAPKPCAAAENRQFDFWVGNWDVFNPQGELEGTNDVRSILGGCVVQENWTGKRGMLGTSFNIWDAPARKWRQSWVDNRGQVLWLDGEFRDGKMVLEGQRPGKKGGTIIDRIQWGRIGGDPNRVRQLWEVSADGGRTWEVAFDGTYVRKS